MSSRSTISYQQLKDLSDVLITALANNDGLKYDSASGKFINTPFGTATDLNISGQASGDILYFNGTNWVRLAKGSNGQYLTLTAGIPAWGTVSSGGSFLMGSHGGVTFVASTVYYLPLYGIQSATTDETAQKQVIPFNFTWSNIRVLVLANNATGNGSVKSRKNNTNGNQNIVITALTTGEFTDGVNTDSIVVSDDINYMLTVGSGGNTQLVSISSKGAS